MSIEVKNNKIYQEDIDKILYAMVDEMLKIRNDTDEQIFPLIEKIMDILEEYYDFPEYRNYN